MLDLKGWDNALAKRGLGYLESAQMKEMRNPKVISARELYQRVARKYGIPIVPLSGAKRNEETPDAGRPSEALGVRGRR